MIHNSMNDWIYFIAHAWLIICKMSKTVEEGSIAISHNIDSEEVLKR